MTDTVPAPPPIVQAAIAGVVCNVDSVDPSVAMSATLTVSFVLNVRGMSATKEAVLAQLAAQWDQAVAELECIDPMKDIDVVVT